MPAKSPAQRRLFAAVVACKEGTGSCKGQVGKIAKGISMKDAKDFRKLKRSMTRGR